MKLNRLLLCGLLTLALILPLCLAEEAGTATPAPTQAAEPTKEPTPAPTEEPTPEPTKESAPEASPEPTATAAPDISAEPTASIEPTASADPTVEPDISAEPTDPAGPTATAQPSSSATIAPDVTPEPSMEPSVSPSVSPSPTPTAVPEPGDIGQLVVIAPEGTAQDVNGVWNIQLSGPDSPLAFTWSLADGSAAQYSIVYVQGGDGVLKLLDGNCTQTRIALSAADYAQGSFTLYVGAVLADESISWGKADFTLAGGMPGGFPGGMGSFGGMPSGGAAMGEQADMGFHVTPGQALTSEHSSGSMDKTAYTDACIETGSEAITSLALGVSQAEITLDGGAGSFYASLQEGRLSLVPAGDGSQWQLSALAMEVLYGSGVDRIAFQLGGTTLSLPTHMELSGSAYGMLRAQGYVDKDILLKITDAGVTATIASKDYRINESGCLEPLEG